MRISPTLNPIEHTTSHTPVERIFTDFFLAGDSSRPALVSRLLVDPGCYFICSSCARFLMIRRRVESTGDRELNDDQLRQH